MSGSRCTQLAERLRREMRRLGSGSPPALAAAAPHDKVFRVLDPSSAVGPAADAGTSAGVVAYGPKADIMIKDYQCDLATYLRLLNLWPDCPTSPLVGASACVRIASFPFPSAGYNAR